MKIKNCTGKETLEIHKVGGDFWISALNENGACIFCISLEMKKPYHKTYKKVELLFNELKNLLKGQEE
jgi:hypothetical protein